MVEPKQKPAGKPVHTADKARIPRTAMRAAWLRTREGTRRLTAKEQQDGQYREGRFAGRTRRGHRCLGGGDCRRGRPARRQKAGTARCPKPPKGPRRKASAGTATPLAAEEPNVLYTKQKSYYAGQEVRQDQRTKPPATRIAVTGGAQSQDARQSRLRHDSQARFPGNHTAESEAAASTLYPRRPPPAASKSKSCCYCANQSRQGYAPRQTGCAGSRDNGQKGCGCRHGRAQSVVGGHTDTGGGHRGRRDHGAACHRGPLHGGDGGGFCVRYFLCR